MDTLHVMIRFEVNGKKVGSEGLVDAWKEAARKGIEENMEARLRSALTPEEYSKLTWSIEGENLDELTLNLSGPDEIVSKAEEAVKD
ncbi:hypothetical protein [Luteolibacter flavescens]|uniref:hypothetical protein n=1 Tax=Luteolibacter flavescens TaxID=1859460 RepID=UPI002223B11F|nr:hypothetical protein [Luteolibacter flavescens]